MTAFSINWPYVAFSGLNSSLVILNAYNRKMVHRINLGNENDRFNKTTILKTFITDTNDLFILVHSYKIYLVYKMDLDEI